jgi:hypothetical protein
MARRKKDWRDSLPKLGRDGVLFFVGLLGIAHETLIADAERPTLLFAFMAMVGLPAFLRADERNPPEAPAPPPEPTPPPEPEPPARPVRKRARP